MPGQAGEERRRSQQDSRPLLTSVEEKERKKQKREERLAENKLKLDRVGTWLRRCEVFMNVHTRWRQEIFQEKIGPIGPQTEALKREIAAAIQLEKELEEHFGYPPPK